MSKAMPASLPAPMTAAEPGTFAHHTIVQRLPDTARRVLVENDLTGAQQERLGALIAEIPHRPLRPLQDPGAPDEGLWKRWLPVPQRSNWLQPPWFLVEMYFFRRVLEATGFYQPGPGQGQDPYAFQKQQGLEAALPALLNASAVMNSWLKPPADQREQWIGQLAWLFKLSLWGNQVDLSLWPAEALERPDHADIQQGEAFLLCDQSQEAAIYLLSHPAGRVDILVDNAGQELALDLLLATWLLGSGAAQRVALQLKPHPTYVSDATLGDVFATLAFFHAQGAVLGSIAHRLQGWLRQRRLLLKPDFFWTSPNAAWDMPARLRTGLGRSRLVISKGDAHYRRLLGDRNWSFDTPFEQVLSYFPTPLLALRVAKSEVMVGLQAGQAEALASRDSKWLTSGRWGAIQFRRVH